MYDFIKRWKERRSRKAILKDIKEAKDWYIGGYVHCMCYSFLLFIPTSILIITKYNG